MHIAYSQRHYYSPHFMDERTEVQSCTAQYGWSWDSHTSSLA